ncbi:MAG: hypothetical protein ABWY50_09630, partial [Aeromicrobium sp.]
PVDCGLPGSDIPKAVTWIREQDAELQYVEDLAFLLEKSGKASFDAPSGQISDLRDAMIDRLSDKMQNLDDMDNPGDREEMERIAEIMGHYTQDPIVSTGLVENLGPQGLSVAIQHMQHWVGDDSMPAYLGEDAYPEDPVAERERIEALQDALATNLAAMLGTASRQPGFDPEFGRDLVEQGDPWSVAVLMDYGDESANYPGFGKEFLVSSGEAMLEREHEWGGNGSWSWVEATGAPSYRSFGTDHTDDAAMNDPVLQWMQVLDDNPDASQEIMLDEDRMKYLLGDRKSEYEDPDGKAAGDALRAATVDQALGFDPRYDDAGGIEDQRARNAAIISANVLDKFGGDAEPLDGVDEEIGGIVATYIADVDRTAQSRSGQDGDIYSNGELLPDWLQDGEGGRGMPAYGIKMNYDDLRGILHDVGDNDTAKSVIGQASTNYNQARMNHYAAEALSGGHVDPDRIEVGGDDPFMGSVNSSAQLNGFLTDGLVTGDIENEEQRAEARRGVAEFFTMPLDAIPTGKTGPVGGFIVGEVKDQIIDGYVGDGVQSAITDGESSFNETAVSTRLQALHTAVTFEGDGADGEPTSLPVGALRDDWPRDEVTHDYVTPGNLTDDQIAAILNDTENGGGYAGPIGREVDGAVGTLMQNYGDK